MAWKVIAGIQLPERTEIREHEFGTYLTKDLAQWWAINGQNVWLEGTNQTFLAKTPLLVYMRLEEV